MSKEFDTLKQIWRGVEASLEDARRGWEDPTRHRADREYVQPIIASAQSMVKKVEELDHYLLIARRNLAQMENELQKVSQRMRQFKVPTNKYGRR